MNSQQNSVLTILSVFDPKEEVLQTIKSVLDQDYENQKLKVVVDGKISNSILSRILSIKGSKRLRWMFLQIS